MSAQVEQLVFTDASPRQGLAMSLHPASINVLLDQRLTVSFYCMQTVAPNMLAILDDKLLLYMDTL